MLGSLFLKIPGAEAALLVYSILNAALNPYRLEGRPTIRDIHIDETGLAVLADDDGRPPVPLRLGHKVTAAQLAAALGPSCVIEECPDAASRASGMIKAKKEMRRNGLEKVPTPAKVKVPSHD
jgi:hypothetical protein